MTDEPAGATAPAQCDLAVIGAGVVGLAVARELSCRHPRLSVCVLERETRVGAHQSGHNSGVVHAGVYYPPGSLKARLCTSGARELYAYCAERGIRHERCGKLIIATAADELGRLEELERRGRANGVPGLRRLDAHEIGELEPHARGLAALHSPATGIADFAGVAAALADDVRGQGGTLVTDCAVRSVSTRPDRIALDHDHGTLQARHALFCAGLWADRLAVAAGAPPDPRIVPFRGAYLRLVPQRRHLVRSLIYPVPDPALPFLGVHLTRHLSGDVLVGPTALLAGARDAYRQRRVRLADVADTLAWPGSWRLFGRFWRTGLSELGHAVSVGALVGAAARFVPQLRRQDAEPAWAGVRAQALGRDGRLVDDFVFSATARALHVRNAPSPAATSCLAIGRHIAAQAQDAFGLTR